VPVFVAIIAWLSQGAEPALSWDTFMAQIGIRDTQRYTKLVCLGLMGVGVALVYRFARTGR